MDYGKHKFGGPFTEEEVEDVKTILRMLVFSVILFVGYLISDGSKSLIHTHTIPSTADTRSCVESVADIVSNITAVIMIPAYHLAMLSLVKNKLPTFLQRIGAGLLLAVASLSLDLTLDTIGHTLSNSTQCMCDTSSVPANTLPISPYWLLIPDILTGVSNLLIKPAAIEFALAQIPKSLRGTVAGVSVAIITIGQIIHPGIISILSQLNLNNVTPSCGFYYYLVQAILIMLFLVMFVIVAKRYKLRERDRHFNIQAIVEEHYERDFDQEEEYMREATDMDKTLFHTADKIE